MGGCIVGKDGLQYQVYPMSPSDLDRIVQIEELSFTHPWTWDQFLEELNRQPFARCLVSALDQKVCGYIMAWLIVDELHITNLAVDPSVRGRGVARGLVTTLIRDSLSEGAVWSELEVRRSNLAAQALYKELGFKVLGCRKGYYPDGEDALVMGLEM
ncbi:MAG: ribosomal protein S18-alanine N-acetyltransferase [Deltaproteobacteria bacterium]|nr:ribosomal protein S18-alanine N-acetyltransferase [Deltaproteobacteria bacterium]